jgi:hypothetical protein
MTATQEKPQSVAMRAWWKRRRAGKLWGWHPISTCPRNGTSVLLWHPSWQTARQGFYDHIGTGDWWYFVPDEPPPDHRLYSCGLDDATEDECLTPTHWHGLPDPPAVIPGNAA